MLMYKYLMQIDMNQPGEKKKEKKKEKKRKKEKYLMQSTLPQTSLSQPPSSY